MNIVDQLYNYLDKHISAVTAFGLKVLFTIIVYIIGRKLISIVVKITDRSLQKVNADKGVHQFVLSFTRFSLNIVLIMGIALYFGLEPTSVAALLGSVGVAIGLALQGSLANFAGGILILSLKPFVVGDYILEDTNKNEGIVKEIQIFYTKLQTVDNQTVVVPNGVLANSSLTNITGQDNRRLDIKIGISYDADLLKAKSIIKELVDKNEKILKDKDIFIVVEDLADSAVIIGCKAWVHTDEYWSTKWQLLEELKLRFDKENIEIPYNQLQVHLNKD